MNSTRSLLKRARTIAQLGALAIATLGLVVACGNDIPLDGRNTGKGGASTGSAGKPGKPGDAGSTEEAGSAGAGEAGEAGEGGAPGAGDMQPGGGGMQPGGGTGGSGFAGGAQGGNAGAPATCGNNKLEAGEECDDGNTKDWDGCTSTCKSKCELCEKKYCLPAPTSEDVFLNCFTDQGSWSNLASGNGLAVQGPAQGQPKQKLCAKLVECMRRTNCGQDTQGPVRGCFCGAASTKDCNDPLKGAKGPCAAEAGAAAESMALAEVSQRWSRTDWAVGAATKVALQCDADLCPAECFKDKILSPCERCTFGDHPLGYWAGSAPYYQCHFQPVSCTLPTGQSSSTCPATTCAPAADCALATHCAQNDVTDCYGTTGQGPCAAQFAAATGSSDPATVLDRLKNGGDFASSTLVYLLEAERDASCKSTCFPGSGGGSGGSGGAGSGGASAGTGG